MDHGEWRPRGDRALTFQDPLGRLARLLDAPPHVHRPRLHLLMVRQRRVLKVGSDRHVLVFMRLIPVLVVVPAVHAVALRMAVVRAVVAPAIRVVVYDTHPLLGHPPRAARLALPVRRVLFPGRRHLRLLVLRCCSGGRSGAGLCFCLCSGGCFCIAFQRVLPCQPGGRTEACKLRPAVFCAIELGGGH